MTIYDTSAAAAIRLIQTFKNPTTLTHQTYTLTPDGAGGNSVAWSSTATGIEAAVIPLSGQERLQAERLNYEATHAVYMTYASGSSVTTKDRFLFGSRSFAIVDARNIGEANAAFRFLVKENVGD